MKVQEWLDLVNPWLDPRQKRDLEAIMQPRAEQSAMSKDRVLCHGDARLANVLFTAHRAVLIDTEALGLGPRMYESRLRVEEPRRRQRTPRRPRRLGVVPGGIRSKRRATTRGMATSHPMQTVEPSLVQENGPRRLCYRRQRMRFLGPHCVVVHRSSSRPRVVNVLLATAELANLDGASERALFGPLRDADAKAEQRLARQQPKDVAPEDATQSAIAGL